MAAASSKTQALKKVAISALLNPLYEAFLGRLEAAQLPVPIASAVAGSHGRWMGMHSQNARPPVFSTLEI